MCLVKEYAENILYFTKRSIIFHSNKLINCGLLLNISTIPHHGSWFKPIINEGQVHRRWCSSNIAPVNATSEQVKIIIYLSTQVWTWCLIGFNIKVGSEKSVCVIFSINKSILGLQLWGGNIGSVLEIFKTTSQLSWIKALFSWTPIERLL